MSDDGRCTSCGARMPAADGACPYCGAAAAAPVAVSTTPDPVADHAAALAAVRAHPSFDSFVRDVPPVSGIVRATYVLPIVVGTMFIVVPAAIAGVLIVTDVIEHVVVGLVAAAFLSIFVLIGVGVIVGAVRTRRRILGGPPRAAPAVVLAKRTEPGTNATSYYVTLGFEGGERHEFGALDSVFRSAFEGDAGVAHCRGELLLGFRKLPM